MERREFNKRLQQVDPDAPHALEELAALFEEDYLSEGRDLKDPAVSGELRARTMEDLEIHMARYDAVLEKLKVELRRAGATEAQINWELFGNVELPPIPYFLCNIRARKLIRISHQILFCLAELKMLGKYTDVDEAELARIRCEYGRRFG